MTRFLILSAAAGIGLLCTSLFSQEREIQFRKLSTNEGLSSALVITINKDQQGFLWFGTMVGLNRYDGYQFRIFKNDPSDSTSISDDWINSIINSRNGDLWVGTQNKGLNRYDYASESFTRYVNIPGDTTTLTDNGVITLCEDTEGILWIGTWNSGVCWKRPSENIIRHFKSSSCVSSVLVSSSVASIIEGKNGDIWIGTSQGICRINKKDKESGKSFIYSADYFYPTTVKRDIAVNRLYIDSKGDLYAIMKSGGVYIYNSGKDEFRLYSFGMDSKEVRIRGVNCLSRDDAGRYWIGTSSEGLYLADPREKKFEHFQYRIGDETSLPSSYILAIYKDNFGIMWLATADGISSYNHIEKQFVSYLYRAGNPDGLNCGSVVGIAEDDDGGFWCATHGGGLNYLPKGAHKFLYFRNNTDNSSAAGSDFLMSMSNIRDNTLWMGGRDGGLVKFNIRTKKSRHYLHDPRNPNSISANAIMEIYVDRKGNVWAGTQGGLDRFDPVHEIFTHYRYKPNDSTSLSGNDIWSILEDSSGYIWVGTQRHGLNRLDTKTGQCIRFLNSPNNPHTILSNSVYALHEYPIGTLWMGTTAGLNRMELNTFELKSYTTKDGLAEDDISDILHDSKERLWLGSTYISQLDLKTGKIRNFDKKDGIRCSELNQESAYVGRDGKMYFGANEGYIVFHPDSIYDNTYIPPIALTNFKVFEESRNLPRDYSKGIELSYEEDYFSFEFAALSFTAVEKNHYRYKLEGFDHDWVSCGTRRFALYTQVDPGDYVFRVQGSNNDGIWNTTGVSIAVHIIPPFWKTTWFRLSVLIAFASIVGFSLHLRIKYLKQRTKDQQELSRKLLESQEDERKRIGAGLHDSIGQNLLVIKNLAVVGLEAGKNKRTTDEQLSEISQLASQTLSEVREISYNLRPYHLDQLGLTGALRAIVSRVASSSRTEFSEDMDVLNSLFSKEQEINIFRIVQEAVNNIIKHSRASKANITIKKERFSVNFIISDNGKGFDQSKRGFGLTGIAERVRILNGSFSLRSGQGTGTTITVSIPLGERYAG